MNEAPSNQTGGFGDTFSSQPATGTNPFTADLKGEFTSNFGTNTNAVSQIFKEGGFTNNNRTKYLIIGGVAVVLLAVIFFILTGESDNNDLDNGSDLATSGDDVDAEKVDGEESEEGMDKAADTAETPAEKPEELETHTAVESAPAPATTASSTSNGGGVSGGPISLTEPADGASLNYDESHGPATFSWSGGGGHIVFSRNQSMNPVTLRVRVSGNSYDFHHPWPGTWYWRMENGSGSTEVRSFSVHGPQRRNIQISSPAGGGSISGNGGVVSWQGDGAVAYYRVELSSGGWANPQFRFGTSGNSVALQGVAAGQYQMRVGAFSEVAGRWEYTSPVAVTVQ